MTSSWPVINIDDWTVAGIEKQGRHAHDWLRKGPPPERTWLFKPARPDRDRAVGEDVAEKLGSEIAHLLGVPAAHVELATRVGRPGALVLDARPSGWELQAGQVLMLEPVPDYDPDDPVHRGYNVESVQRALNQFAPPPGADLPTSFDAFDVFAGFLLFDALIAHGDRHDRNWAVLIPPPGVDAQRSLCASYDHAASFGFLLTEASREKCVEKGGVRAWASRGRANRFERKRGRSPQTLVELAASAISLCPSSTAEYWRERLSSVDAGSIEDQIGAAPGLSATTRRFVLELIAINRERLLDVIC